jgi:hypothetical protein
MNNAAKQIAFSLDRFGKKLAFVWSGYGAPGTFGRWLRIGLDKAELLISTEHATQVEYVKPLGSRG